MNRKLLSVMIAFTLVALGASYAAADVVYDNGGPDRVDGFNITKASFIAADDFVLSQNTTITDVHFWGLFWQQDSTQIGGFNWAIYSNLGNSGFDEPGSLVGSGSGTNVVATPTGNIYLGFPEYEFSFDLDTPQPLSGSTNYWLALQADFSVLFWETSGGSNGAFAVQADDFAPNPYAWRQADFQDLAFQLTAASAPVPEPSTLLLLGSGLVGLVGFGRKKFKK
jgi:hypothetical protein